MKIIFIILLSLSFANLHSQNITRESLLNNVSGTIYYLDANNGDDDWGNGSESNPWKTLVKAQRMAVENDAVILKDGEYGRFTDNTDNPKNDFVLWINEEGNSPVFTSILSYNQQLVQSFNRFYGIKIAPEWVDPASSGNPGSNDPQYPDSEGGTYAKTAIPFECHNASKIELINCELVGTNKHLTVYGARISGSNDVLIERCHIHLVNRGVTIVGSNNISIRYNHINEHSASCIQLGSANNSDILIEGNHGHDSNFELTDDYCPRAQYHTYHASAVAIRGDNITVRGNIFHDGYTSSGLMTYSQGGTEESENITIENNLLYDIHAIAGVLRIFGLANNFIVRNNTFIGKIRDINDGRYKYRTAFSVEEVAPGYANPRIKLYNNIMLGTSAYSDEYVEENNNIFWSLKVNKEWKDDIYLASLNSSSKVITSTFNNIPDYFFNDFFSTVPVLDERHGQTLDFTLSDNSEAINFGNVSFQTEKGLGSLNSEGFIQSNGYERNSDHHSAGCYEYPATSNTETSLLDVSVDKINVYPNPVGDFLTIKFKEPINGKVQVNLVSFTGKSQFLNVKNEMNDQKSLTINLQGISKGAYLLKAKIGKQYFNKVIIKN